MCIKFSKELKSRLENLLIILYENDTQVDEIRLISASLDILLVKLIQNSCMSEYQENELRLLINELNLSAYLENINRVREKFTRERISQINKI
jgi:hypothetical protein